MIWRKAIANEIAILFCLHVTIHLITIFYKWNTIFFALLFTLSSQKSNTSGATMYSIICIFNHTLHLFPLIIAPVDLTFHCSCWVNNYPNCREAVFWFLSYGFLPDGTPMPERGILALKTNYAAPQTDNITGSTHANQQIYLQNSYNSLFKSICTAAWHRLYRHLFTGLLCFFLCATLLFYAAASPFALLTNGSDSFFLIF